MTSANCGTTDQFDKGCANRQPDVNHNGVEKSSSVNEGDISPGPFTSFHGLSLIEESLAQGGEGI